MGIPNYFLDAPIFRKKSFITLLLQKQQVHIFNVNKIESNIFKTKCNDRNKSQQGHEIAYQKNIFFCLVQ